MKELTCSFFGHSTIVITESLISKSKMLIEDLICNKNVKYFYFGGFGDFDDLCWKIVTEMQEKYPNIKRIYCLEDARYLKKSKRPRYLKDEDYEEYIYLPLSFDYWYTRIYYRNCEMINRSDYVVFYVEDTQNSGAYKALKYARKMNKLFYNLGLLIEKMLLNKKNNLDLFGKAFVCKTIKNK